MAGHCQHIHRTRDADQSHSMVTHSALRRGPDRPTDLGVDGVRFDENQRAVVDRRPKADRSAQLRERDLEVVVHDHVLEVPRRLPVLDFGERVLQPHLQDTLTGIALKP